jgi:hypothetical protein
MARLGFSSFQMFSSVEFWTGSPRSCFAWIEPFIPYPLCFSLLFLYVVSMLGSFQGSYGGIRNQRQFDFFSLHMYLMEWLPWRRLIFIFLGSSSGDHVI